VETAGIFIGETASSLETLPKDLARIIAKPKPTNERIYLRAGKAVRYSRFMEIISRLRATGYAQIAMINEEL
jgi:biopolymer transport protein ExbD